MVNIFDRGLTSYLIFCLFLLNVVIAESAHLRCEGDCDEGKSEEDADEEDEGSSVIEQIRNIGTAGVAGIIIGAAAIVVIVPMLYCFLCGWLCFDKERTKMSKIKSIKEASKASRRLENPEYMSQMESDKIRMDEYLRRLSISQLPSHFLESGTRQNSFMSHVSSRRNSGVTNGSKIVENVEETKNEHFSQPPLELSHVYTVLFSNNQKLS